MDDHVRVENQGSIVTLVPISDAARAWLAENVGEPEGGGVYRIEPRYAEEIIWACARAVLRWQ